MDEWSEIRRRVLVEGESRRQILRETKMHWRTLQKILTHSQPPGYRQHKPRAKRKLGDYLSRIEQILQEDQALPRKQRHTAKRIWERLRSEGFTGGYTVVKEAVRELTQRNREVFVPLVHPPRTEPIDIGIKLKCDRIWTTRKLDGPGLGEPSKSGSAPWGRHEEMRKRIARAQEGSRTSRLPQKHCYHSSMSGI